MTTNQGRHMQNVQDLKARIAELEPSDPASLADRLRLQAQLASALKMAQTGTPSGTQIRRHRAHPTLPQFQPGTGSFKPAPPTRGLPQKSSGRNQPFAKALSLPIAIPSASGALQQWSAVEWGKLVQWCEGTLRDRRRLSSGQLRELEVLRNLLWIVNRLGRSQRRMQQIEAVHTQLRKMQTILHGSVRDAGGGHTKRQTPAGSQSRGSGETMAIYNRLQQVGKNLSFEESVALRQGSRRTQGKLLSEIDRASGSGQDDIDELDW